MPVKLPTTADATKTYEGVVATASGWGKFNNGLYFFLFLLKLKSLISVGSSSSLNLNQVNMAVISNTKCAAIYGTSVIIASGLCTNTSTAKSTCQVRKKYQLKKV